MSAPGLLVRDLTVGYGREPIVHGVSLPELAPGTVTALVGPNAAGKSTLLRGLAGLAPARGAIVLGGTDLQRLAPAARARFATYMPQSLPQRVHLSVVETVLAAMHASPLPSGTAADEATALALLERLGIGELAMASLDRLSGGQRQLASLAQSLARRPSLLLLDEPTSALDLRFQLVVADLLRELAAERRMVVVTVLHDLALAVRAADLMVILDRGQVHAVGSPETVVTPAALAEVYGVAARIETCSQGQPLVIADRPLSTR
ncbi:MAG: ABC transporter ATP-binding protein [Geminicoccaceae bacterium]